MFNRIETELKFQGKTKVWLADILDESTQNINNWKKRGVPAAKVKAIANALQVSRAYLEGEEHQDKQIVATPQADYKVEKNGSNSIKYVVFINTENIEVEKLLHEHLKNKGELNYVYVTNWKYADPFIELDLWLGSKQATKRLYLLLNCIVGITEYLDNQ